MPVPALIQVSPVDQSVAYSTARTLTFGAGVTAGSTVVVCGLVRNPGAVTIAGVTASVTMSGAVFQRRAERGNRFEANLGTILWVAENVSSGATAITVTPSILDVNNVCSLVALEFSAAAVSYEGAVSADSPNGVTSLAIGPMPASGVISQADTLALLVTAMDQGGSETASVGWQTPVGWTAAATMNDPSGAKRPTFVAFRTQAGQSAISVTTASTASAIYGRSGILAILRGAAAAPPPGPPPPPPPPPAPVGTQSIRVEDVNADSATVTDVDVDVFPNPSSGLLGATRLFFDDALNFQLEGGKAVLYIPVPAGISLTTGSTVKVVGQRGDGSAGFRGVADGTVVDV